MEFIFQLFAEMLGKNEYMEGLLSDNMSDETSAAESFDAETSSETAICGEVEAEAVPEANIFSIVNFH